MDSIDHENQKTTICQILFQPTQMIISAEKYLVFRKIEVILLTNTEKLVY